MSFIAETRREIDHAADRRIVPSPLVSECAKCGVALRDADAELEAVPQFEPTRAQGREPGAHRQRHPRRAFSGLGRRKRIVEENQNAIAREAIERAAVRSDDRTHGRVIVAQHVLHFFGLGGVGKRSEAAQIDKHITNFAPVGRQNRPLASRQNRLGYRRREKPLELVHPLDLHHLLVDTLLEPDVPFLQLIGLPQHFVLQRFHAQQRSHPGKELRLIDRLG